jgi:cytoskeletal protein RodZ
MYVWLRAKSNQTYFSMKQVYLKENGKNVNSPTAHIRGWVFFIGLLVWLMAVADSFGQGNPSNQHTSGSYLSASAVSANGIAGRGTQVKNETCTTGSSVSGPGTSDYKDQD